MKKSMIAAGAASLALAAMPVVGVFAAASQVDTLNLTVTSSCAMTNTAGSGATTNTYTATAGLNETVTFAAENSDPTILTVVCNSGYTITPTFTKLDGPSTDDIEYASTLAAGKWTAGYKLGSAASFTPMTSSTAITSATSSTTDAYSFEYKAQTTTTQTQGTYTGTATYVLAATANQ